MHACGRGRRLTGGRAPAGTLAPAGGVAAVAPPLAAVLLHQSTVRSRIDPSGDRGESDLARSYLVSLLCDTRFFFCRNQNIITFCRGSRVLIAQFMSTRGIKYKNIMRSRECRLLNPFERFSVAPFMRLVSVRVSRRFAEFRRSLAPFQISALDLVRH